jgi:hypothetical protein
MPEPVRRNPQLVPVGTLALRSHLHNPFEQGGLESRWCHSVPTKGQSKSFSFVMVILRDGYFWQFDCHGGERSLASLFFGLSFLDLLLLNAQAITSSESTLPRPSPNLDHIAEFWRSQPRRRGSGEEAKRYHHAPSEELERTARRSFELRANRTLDDREWKQIRVKLMELWDILRGWEEARNHPRQTPPVSAGGKQRLNVGDGAECRVSTEGQGSKVKL